MAATARVLAASWIPWPPIPVSINSLCTDPPLRRADRARPFSNPFEGTAVRPSAEGRVHDVLPVSALRRPPVLAVGNLELTRPDLDPHPVPDAVPLGDPPLALASFEPVDVPTAGREVRHRIVVRRGPVVGVDVRLRPRQIAVELDEVVGDRVHCAFQPGKPLPDPRDVVVAAAVEPGMMLGCVRVVARSHELEVEP